MQRDPSIHIRRSDLIKVLKINGFDANAQQVDKLMRDASKYNIKNRVVVTAPAKTRKKITRTIQAEEHVTDLFNKIYHSVILDNHIKALRIKKTDPQYLTLKEISKQAVDFCNLFDLGYEEGFKVYVRLGIKLLDRRFSIYRLKAQAHKIVEYYQNTLVIDQDPSPEKTTKMYKAWEKAMVTYFGNKDIEVTNINQFVHFVYAKNDAEDIKAPYQDWINAQFEKWSFLNSAPEFSQLNGENAALNYQIYSGKVSKEYSTKEEQTYFKNIKNETETTDKESKQKEAVRKARVQKGLRRD